MEPTVYIILKGRLGNNMYQYAFALSLLDRGYNVACVSGAVDPVHYLDPYVLGEVRIINFEQYKKEVEHKNNAVYLADENPVWIPPLPPPNFLGKHVLINSYFQSEFFFGNVYNDVKYAFRLKEQYEEKCKKYNIRTGQNSCAITVRLTDYLTNTLYTQLDISYYEKAIKETQESNFDGDLIFFNVFSDDIKLAKEKLSPLINKLGIEMNFIDCPDANVTLDFLSKHHYNIIANSTFAWWGAYLKTTSGTVVYPRDWFTREFTSFPYQVKSWIPV